MLLADCAVTWPCASSCSTLVIPMLGVTFVQQAVTLLWVEVPGMNDYTDTISLLCVIGSFIGCFYSSSYLQV